MATHIGVGNTPEKALEFFRNKMAFTTGPAELDYFMTRDDEINIVDVRAEKDYTESHIPGAVNLPEGKWQTAEGLAKDKLNVVYCYSQVCHLAASASIEFAKQGYRVVELEGGFEAWTDSDLKVEGGQKAKTSYTGAQQDMGRESQAV